MTTTNEEFRLSRRKFTQLSASFGLLASLGSTVRWANAATTSDYKALVCIFLFGGNDGHNTIVPMDNTQYAAYAAARGTLAIPQNQLLPVSDPVQGTFGLHPSLPKMQSLFAANKAAVVANVGVLVKPTTLFDYNAGGPNVPSNLRSHSDQVVQMQTGSTGSGSAYGWGGQAADSVQAVNTAAKLPVSVSMNGPAIFCAGKQVPAAALQPGNLLGQNAMSIWPSTAGQARAAAQSSAVSTASGNVIVDAANRQMQEAISLGPLLQQAQGSATWQTPFPQTQIGSQLQDIARLINLRSQVNVGRQVFFATLGGFDTHSGQPYQQGFLLGQLDLAIKAFYDATVQMGISDSVTTFTLSDFGRTLQASGTGSDHGWGSHHFVVGGAVNGGRIHGQFPTMTNYANYQTSTEFADSRGTLLPKQSLTEYGATLARWFGASDPDIAAMFGNFGAFKYNYLSFV